MISLGLLLLSGEAAYATSFSWNVVSGDWFTATNWNPNGVPGAADDATISNGGTCTLDAAASITSFTLSGGTLTGTGTLTVTGTTSWSNGGMVGGGTTNANGPLLISGAGGKSLVRTLNSNVSATWTGSGNIGMGFGTTTSVLNIAAGTTFDVQNDQSIGPNGGTPVINNAGTFQKSAGTGTTLVNNGLAFNNTGSVLVQTGTLKLAEGASTGSFDSTGGTLDFIGTHTLSAAAAITGGNVTFSSYTVNHAGSYSISGTTTVSGGTVNLTGPGATLGNVVLTVFGGTLNASTSSPSSASSLTEAGGTLTGTGTLNVAGTTSWSNGGMVGGGTTNANGPLLISGAGGKDLVRTLNSNVSATWTGSGNIGMGFGTTTSVLNIAAGTTFDVQNDQSIGPNGGTPVINNAGTFQKSAGTGTTTVGTPFNNTGTVQSLSGTLALDAYTQTAGVTRLNGGAISDSATMNIQGGTLEGFGTLTATVNNSGGTLSPGLSPGQLNETGAYTQGASGAFHTEIGGLTVGTQYDRAAISGAATLAGTLNISLINGFEPNIGDTFTVMTFGSRSGDFTTVNGTSIPNGKAFQKNVSGTSVILQVVAATTTTTSTTSTTSTSTSSTTTTSTTSTTSTTVPPAIPALSSFGWLVLAMLLTGTMAWSLRRRGMP